MELEAKCQRTQQTADSSNQQADQMRTNLYNLEQDKNIFENQLMEAQEKLTKSNSALQQIVARFEILKKQNILLQQKLRAVKAHLDGQATTVPGGASFNDEGTPLSTFPNTPSAF